MIKRNGFSLLELTLVLSVGTMVTFMKFQDMKNEQESVLASSVGQQMKQIGEAVNGYINIRYDKLSTLSNAAGNGADPGPRICSGATCEITYQTLVNEGLLPSTFNGLNAFKSGYRIIFQRTGVSPNYIINGIISTTSSWIENGNIRYDLLGKAMQVAGIDSGMTKLATKVDGYQGQWYEVSTNFSNISNAGQLAFRVGFDSALYSVYLRRDGTLPMTGSLNMGGQSIYNTQDINATGTITSNVLHSTGITIVGSDINVSGNGQVNGNLNSNNTISGNAITSRGETYTQNWFRTLGDGGIYFQKYGGGWYMADTNTITAYAGKNVQTAAGFYGGYVHSTGNIDASGNIQGNYLKPNSINTSGTACSDNGQITKDNTGKILSCVNGKWDYINNSDLPVGIPQPWPSYNVPQGWLVANGQAFNKGAFPKLAIVYPSGFLPDLRGVFIRGSDLGRGLDPGRGVMDYQGDAMRNITGTFGVFTQQDWQNGASGAFSQWNVTGPSPDLKNGRATARVDFNASRVVPTADENRPKNLSFIYIIKAE